MKSTISNINYRVALSEFEAAYIDSLLTAFRVELTDDDLMRIEHCRNGQELTNAIVEYLFEQVIEEHDGEEYQELLSYELDGEYSVFYWDGIEEIHSAAELDAAIKAWYNE